MGKWKGRKQERNSEQKWTNNGEKILSTLEFYLGNVLFFLKKQVFCVCFCFEKKGNRLWL